STAFLMYLHNGIGKEDDIDHLGRRRVRTVGELLQKQCQVGLTRTATLMKEKLENTNEEPTISKLVNTKALSGVIRDFFGRNQLSQFMDQTNCLAELTNKRRLSALGPGGLTRERAGFEVRDVHSSHYGRVCPIETPEGPNIGLISSLALYGKIDEYGFIEAPYRQVKDTKVTNKVDYLTADEEEAFVIAQANAPQAEDGTLLNRDVLCRHEGESGEFEREKVQYIDVSPLQMISAAAGLIPFLEHDDANRALMGSNMQRQAVPLLRSERPLVGTGLEEVVARDSRATMNAREDGIVASATAERVIITKDGKLPEETAYPESVQDYHLYKFLRTNASTLFNQRPIVRRGDVVKKGQAIADGASTDGGELALGRNVLVAFMPWHGYNFEDAIIISERLVANDVYTSIHVTLEDVQARETKLGPEEITRDIPNESEESLRNLDADGIVRVGAEVKPGDILVGKITPKNEPDLAPEERLMKAIFGEKASDVKNSSLVVPGGCSGIVMDVRVDRRADPTKAKQTKKDINNRVKDTDQKYREQLNHIQDD
ncbi:MAG: DNA-directed RNA polymerase subunit beta, partial [Victivallales bacterium]|nr:DNA-directed RNA polymerase subunit beta [Victivallales bacterium]